MKKRAVSLSMNTIVIAGLALLILVILILVFRGQIGKTTQSYLDIGKQASEEAKVTDKCETLLGNRVCVQSNCPPSQVVGKQTVSYYKLAEPQKGWSDCKGKVCCEKVIS